MHDGDDVATTLIIDGYNLLGAHHPIQHKGKEDTFSRSGREELLRALAAYRQRKGHAIVVVFDGWRSGSFLEQHEPRSGIDVVYSCRGERADQVIQRLTRDYGTSCAVVSSDHEVAGFARVAGAFVISAAEFWSRLHSSPSSGDMQRFKELDSEADLPSRRRTEKKGNPRKLPKSERKRRQQLKGF
jgi:predicted RNA-binding protein with PIN domain